ncbi:ABC transporter ATP-binding protein [Mycoplasmopsis columbinasalis]|uniref:ABC transporter ATP-binding protein C-terminal domain protein n=1 Tax=Mycoplasmopsis columbinasalis TaxID=114880 RepID=A0A449BAU4_9BACT|nr:ABC transporter ATP-binding protein [Mycoplasmopsis columbinasalis]VEU78314.1 ABC transporter ATP-binding protein C-terminal domain protein [Mycoplasmopsis columbinasalis]
MIKLIKMLPRKIKWCFLLGALLIFLNVICAIIFPNIISQFIRLIFNENSNETVSLTFFDGLINFKPAPLLLVRNYLIIAVVLVTVLNIIFSFVGNLVVIYASESASKFFRISLFEKIQKLSLKNIADLKSESIITRVSNDVGIFWEFLVNGSTILVRGIFLTIGSAVLAFLVDVQMATGVVIVIPVLTVLILIVGKMSGPRMKQAQKTVEVLTKDITENINGIRVIKTYSLENQHQEAFTKNNQVWYRIMYRIEILFATLGPVFLTIINLLILVIYSIAAKQTMAQAASNQTLVELNIFIDYLYNISFGIMMTVMFLVSFFRAKISAGRINQIFEVIPENVIRPEGGEISQNYDLTVQDLSFKYYDTQDKHTLKNISFRLPYRQTLGIIGPTAAGKSTLVNLLINNYLYKYGSIKIGDQELNDAKTKSIHDVVGIVYQEALLYTGTIRSNLLKAKPDATDVELEQALRDACAWEFVTKFEDKLDHVVVQGGRNLSGGQKQRLSIARTLLRKPKILILDDSTSALDNITTKKVIENVRTNYDCTLILISQKIGPLRTADQIMILENGTITALGTHEELIQCSPLYKSIHQNQLDQ